MRAIPWEELSQELKEKWGTKEIYEKLGPTFDIRTDNICPKCHKPLRECCRSKNFASRIHESYSEDLS